MLPNDLDPLEIHDRLLDASDEVICALRKQYPLLHQALGGDEIFHEVRETNIQNAYSIVFLAESLRNCIIIKNHSNLIIKALQIIPSGVLESFQIIYLMPNFRGSGYTEQLTFIHNF